MTVVCWLNTYAYINVPPTLYFHWLYPRPYLVYLYKTFSLKPMVLGNPRYIFHQYWTSLNVHLLPRSSVHPFSTMRYCNDVDLYNSRQLILTVKTYETKVVALITRASPDSPTTSI